MRAMPAARAGKSSFPLVGVLLAVGGAVFLFLLYRGIDYYLLPITARSAARQHAALRPSGSLGHFYGWLGLAIIVSNLLYLARRRFARFKFLGSMRRWLQWHVASGILGPLLVVLHSALTMRTAIAILSSASLAVLVVTGIIGRYLHALVPRTQDGTTRKADDVRADLDHALMHMRGIGPGARLAADALDLEATRILGPLLEGSARSGRVVLVAIRARFTLQRLPALARRVARTAGAPAAELRAVSQASRAIALLELRADAPWLLDAAAVSWRGLHRIFAFLMVWSACLHVSVAFYLGYGF